MMFSGDWRPGVWPAVQVHSLVLGDGGRRGEGRETAALCGRWSGLTLVAVLACLEKGKWASGGDEMIVFKRGSLATAQLAVPQRLIKSCSGSWCLVASRV